MHVQPFHHLDILWIQVAGTQCNLSCAHCFVPSGPGVTRHAMLSRTEVAARVAEAAAMGVKEIYFTGGEHGRERVRRPRARADETDRDGRAQCSAGSV